jgi:hemolysin activation/secretion protein
MGNSDRKQKKAMTPPRRVTGRRRSAWLTASACVVSANAALAQMVAPSQVTPQSLRPAAASPATIALPAAPGLIPPANADNLSIIVSDVVVEGGFPDMAEQTRAIVHGVVGRRVSVAELYAAASAIEAAYGSAGYALARVVVPPQRLNPHGAFKLVVVDGYIESIDAKSLSARQRSVVSARLAPLVGRRHMKLAEIERRVLLAGDVAGLTLKSTLAAGATSGGATLTLNGTERLVTGSSTVDNDLPSSLRNWEVVRNLQINSPFGMGEQFYLSATTGYDIFQLFNGTIPIQIFGGGFVMPIGVDGFTINPEYTNAITRPTPQAGLPPTTGYFQRADLRASYPLIRTRRETLNLSSVLEWDQEYMRPSGFPSDLYDDNYFVWRGRADSISSLSGGVGVEAIGTLSQGLGGRTGVGSFVPLSQQGATPHFTKFDASVRYTQPLPNMFSLMLYGSGQTSFGQPLMVSEQFSLDGPTAVSGFPTGTFVVDEGGFGRAELGRTFLFPVSGTQIPFEPYAFGAAGIGVIDMPTIVQQGTVRLGTLGLGARASVNTNWWFITGADLDAEVARFASDVPGERQGWRGNLSFSLRF